MEKGLEIGMTFKVKVFNSAQPLFGAFGTKNLNEIEIFSE